MGFYRDNIHIYIYIYRDNVHMYICIYIYTYRDNMGISRDNGKENGSCYLGLRKMYKGFRVV